ncbi:glycine zipper domain-containing protein [uncultured Thiodictyon sp.]|uniref:glycine zipper domain-containing protein n=1 Tax=uncultured Thiodictyon sp. TaxID=1846217 RepID=UPI0025E0663D|nr:glycine zipper domain-containing protein [uncultured Thiodictyon sp.]
MKLTTISVLAITLAALSGCGTTTAERVGSGAVMGAATGAAVGSMSANAGKGALIGAGAGALGGLVVDQNQRTNQNNRNYRN